MPTKTSVGPNEVVRLEVLRLIPPLRSAARHWACAKSLARACAKSLAPPAPLRAATPRWGPEISAVLYVLELTYFLPIWPQLRIRWSVLGVLSCCGRQEAECKAKYATAPSTGPLTGQKCASKQRQQAPSSKHKQRAWGRGQHHGARATGSCSMWTQARAPRPHRTCLCKISRAPRTATSRNPPMGPRNKCCLVRARADLFFAYMATTTDPLVRSRCSFVLWASGSGVQGQIRKAKACHERNMARRATARSESKQQAGSNKTNLTKRKRNSRVLRAYLCPSRPMECNRAQGWYVEQL